MADLTANAPIRIWNGKSFSERWNIDTSGAQTIYKGQALYLDTSADAIYVTAFLDAQTVSTTDIFIGIAAESVSVAASAVELNADVEVYVDRSIIGFKSAIFADADVGDQVYMSDSATLSKTASENIEIGKLHRVHEGYVYVKLVSPFITANAT